MEIFLHYGWLFLQIVMIIGGLFTTIIGIVTVVQWLRTPNEPNDQSNRINNIMSWWIGLTRPDIVGHHYFAFQQDVMDNVEDIQWANTPLEPLPQGRPVYERVDDERKCKKCEKRKKKKKS